MRISRGKYRVKEYNIEIASSPQSKSLIIILFNEQQNNLEDFNIFEKYKASSTM